MQINHLELGRDSEIEQLVQGLRRGENWALKSFHDRYATPLYRTCRKYYLSHEDAEEVVQDVILTVWNKRAELRPDLSFMAYVSMIARNATFKKARKNIMYFTLDNYLGDEQLNAGANAEDVLIGTETEKIIESLISELPAKKQKVYIMSRIQGLSHDEIADAMGLSRRTVENHIYQTNLLIKEKLNLNCWVLPLVASEIQIFL